ncbi:MAG TPA: TSUP family transporter, partial [Negativicutes bacterium]|nr:TSUP family transporter [Negativicutes bacterium]
MSNIDPATLTLVLSSVSFFAGFIDSIAGGGGLLLLPALLFAGIPPQIVLGTNKFAGTLGTSMALVNFVRSKKVVGRIVSIGIVFSLLGTILGSKSILLFP